MAWFIAKLRSTAIRGMVKKVFPLAIDDQFSRYASLAAPAARVDPLTALRHD